MLHVHKLFGEFSYGVYMMQSYLHAFNLFHISLSMRKQKKNYDYRLHKTDQQRLKPMHLEIKESKKYVVIVWKFEIVRKKEEKFHKIISVCKSCK